MVTKEIWKVVFDGNYEASSFGRIRSLHKNTILKQQLNSWGYLRLNLGGRKKRKHFLAHRLIAEAFIPNPENKSQINHKDGNKTNNHVGNLEWCTSLENITHARSNGLSRDLKGAEHAQSKLTDKEALEIFNSKAPIKRLAKKYNISFSVICGIRTGAGWSHLTGKKHESQRLSNSAILEIFNATEGITQLLKKHSISKGTYFRIKSGRRNSKITGKVFSGRNKRTCAKLK